MKVYLKQKFITLWHGAFYVKDENDKSLFEIKNTKTVWFKLMVRDMEGNEFFMVKKRYFRFFSRFDICTPKGKLLFIIKRKFSFFTKKYKIIDKTKKDVVMTLNGDVWAWNFTLKCGEDAVAHFKKKLIAFVDTYEVDVVDDKSVPFAIAVMIALDGCHHSSSSNNNSKFNMFNS
ncbi:MAG: LURP-one-related family protein [Clostridia bacterium]